MNHGRSGGTSRRSGHGALPTEGEGPRSAVPAVPEPSPLSPSRAPRPGQGHPPPARSGEGELPRHSSGGISYLCAAHGSLCRNIAPWQVAASLAAPAGPLPARRGRLQHPWQRGGQGLPRGFAGAAAGRSPTAFVARISSRPRGRTQRFTAPCPLNRTGLLIIVAPLKG